MLGGVRISCWVGIRQSGSDFNEGVHNLAREQNSAQHRTLLRDAQTHRVSHNLVISCISLLSTAQASVKVTLHVTSYYPALLVCPQFVRCPW